MAGWTSQVTMLNPTENQQNSSYIVYFPAKNLSKGHRSWYNEEWLVEFAGRDWKKA